MARELSDPDVASAASRIVGKGMPPVIAPRGPIKPTAPDEGPITMPSFDATISGKPGAPQPGSGGMPQMQSPLTSPGGVQNASMYIPGGSRHEIIRIDEGAADQVIEYPVGVGSWQSRSHAGSASSPDCSIPAQGMAPAGIDPSDVAGAPRHSSEGESAGNPAVDTNSKSYESAPVCMDYTSDMGGAKGHS